MANWAGTATATLVLLFLTPYVVSRLGDERFGIYAMANQSLLYVNLLALGMRGTVTRFVTKEITADNLDGLNATLSSIALFYLIIGSVGIVVCGLLGMAAPTFFDVDSSYAAETQLLFLAVGCNFLFGLLGLAYSGVLVGRQRYDLLNLGNILRDLSKGGLIVLLFAMGWATLGGLAYALVIAHVLALVYFRHASRRQQPGLRIRLHTVKVETTRRILGFSIWNGLIQIGNVMTFATPVFIVAKMLGPEQVVFYSVPFMMADRLRIGVVGMANTLAPMAATTLVTGDREYFRTLLIKGTRAAATLCFALGAVLLVFCEPFLHLWMGPEYARSWTVYAVLMIAMFGRISQTPTLHVLVGGGRIAGLAYIQMASAAATLLLSISLALWTSWGVLAVAAGVTIPLFLSHTIFLPCYAARQMDVSVWQYVRRSYLWPTLSTLPGVGFGLWLSRVWPPTSWGLLAVEAALSLGVIAVLAWYTCVDAAIRRRFLKTLGIA
ncbi:MAG: oligosaccharide flippase family protein [Phycisphaerae bacterium]